MVIPAAVYVLEAVYLSFPGWKKLMFHLECDLTFYSHLSSVTEIQNKLSPQNSHLLLEGLVAQIICLSLGLS